MAILLGGGINMDWFKDPDRTPLEILLGLAAIVGVFAFVTKSSKKR